MHIAINLAVLHFQDLLRFEESMHMIAKRALEDDTREYQDLTVTPLKFWQGAKRRQINWIGSRMKVSEGECKSAKTRIADYEAIILYLKEGIVSPAVVYFERVGIPEMKQEIEQGIGNATRFAYLQKLYVDLQTLQLERLRIIVP